MFAQRLAELLGSAVRFLCSLIGIGLSKQLSMGSASIGQLMADMRQLVINLQTREHATDSALAKSQIVNDKISGMKEYQDEVANMNDCWRMQGRKVLVANLQHENRQILQLQQENRELRQALEDCENTLQLVMQKHRDIVTKLAKQFIPPFRTLVTEDNKKCEVSAKEKIVNLSRLLNECLEDGESISNHDQELIARLTTENACLRELLHISTYNDPNIARHFLDITSSRKPNYTNGLTAIHDKNCEQSSGDACILTGDSFLHNEEDIRQNSVLMKKILNNTTIKKNAIFHAQGRKQCGRIFFNIQFNQ
ncbi:FGFR1 oncogene partner [Dirofilaria immitis]